MNVRPCGNPDCRVCRRRVAHAVPRRDDTLTLAELLVSAAAIVAVFILLIVLLPVLA